MINLPDLNKVKLFHSIYKTRSLTRTAETLSITRSAVSQGLQALEYELGTKLFIRNSKRVITTEAGELLFSAVDSLFTELETVVVTIETGKKEAIGHLRIGAPQDFGSIQLTGIINQFHKLHPNITFELVLSTPLHLLEELSAGNLDIAFIDNGDLHAKSFPVSITTVFRESFIPVCSKEYFEKNLLNTKGDYIDLKEQTFIDYFKHAPVAKMWLTHQFRKSPPSLKVSFSAESVRALIRATEGGLGIAILPKQMIENKIKSGHLKHVYPEGKELINQITLSRRLERPITAREQLFVEFFKKSRNADVVK